ncbi:hypothetical protein D047_2077 [Vibrio parahaemolyticus VPTS-2010_2]|nr:hypothetical protein D047_2077 [Vibrio parahaemolyticus VPTS-2010_2]
MDVDTKCDFSQGYFKTLIAEDGDAYQIVWERHSKAASNCD